MIENKLFWKLPHDVRRSAYKYARPEEFSKLNSYRDREPGKITAQTFKPFLETNSLFVHIPKAAGIAIGHGIYGRHTGNHTSIAEYKMAFSKTEFESMFKFTFVRNPWDRLLSAFLFMKAGGRNEGDKLWSEKHLSKFTDFETFVSNWVNEDNVYQGIHFKPQHSFLLTPESEFIQVDFVGQFENLEEDWNHLKMKLNAAGNLKTVNANPNRVRDYKTAYNDKTAAIVEHVFKKDIDLFGYSFS